MGEAHMHRPSIRRLGVGTLLALVASIFAISLASPISAAPPNLVDNNGYWIQNATGGFTNFVGNPTTVASPVAPPECSDGINNDEAKDAPGTFQDTAIDYPADPQCFSATDNSETYTGSPAANQPKAPISFASFITKAGAMTSLTGTWPSSYIYTTQGLITFSVNAAPSATPSSWNATTGAVSIKLNLTLTIKVEGPVTFSCSTAAFPVSLTTTNTNPAGPVQVTPSAYDPSTGMVTVADNTFAVPATSNSLVQGFCDLVNSNFGLPVYNATTPAYSTPGTSAIQFNLRSFPATSLTAMNNHQPVAVAGGNQTVSYGAPVTLTGGGTDVDTVPAVGTPPTPGPIFYKWTQTAGPAVPSFSQASIASPGANVFIKSPTFTPPAAGDYTFQLQVADGGGTAYSPTTATTSVHVNLPTAPVAAGDSYSTAYNTPLTVTAPGLLGNDSGTGITVTGNTTPAHGSATVNADGSLTYTPTTNYAGSDSFTYTVTDVASQTSTATVNLTVNPSTTATATDDTYSTPSNTELDVAAPGLLGNDSGASITVTSQGSASHGTATVNADGSFSYVPDANYQGTDSFTYTITTSFSTTASATVHLTVTNTAPIASAGDDFFVHSGDHVTLDGSLSTDPDGGPSPLTYSWTQTSGPSVSLSGASTSSPSFNAPVYYCNPGTAFTFRLTVGDGTTTSSASVIVTVGKVIGYGHPIGDYNGDGTADPAVYNATTATWQIRCQGTFQFGAPGDIAVPGDYTGDGTTDVATYTPKTSPGGNGTWVGNEGLWKIRNQPTFRFAGLQGDIPVPADYFGDSSAHAALFRPSTGQWFIRPAGAPQFGPVTATVVTFGQAGDVPIPGDYDGDGVLDLALYRPSTGQWIIGHGLSPVSPTITKPNFPPNLKPVVADYDGDHRTDIMAVDPTTGKWYQGGHGNIAVAWGQAGDAGFSGDYDGNGAVEIGRYRASSVAVIDGEPPFYFGGAGYLPVNAWFTTAPFSGA